MQDPNNLLRLEKAIIEKYGEATVKNPKATWTDEKEKEYLQQLKELAENHHKTSQGPETIEIDGVLIPKKLFTKENNRICFACKCYSFKKDDDIYLSKFKTCFKCYIQYVEGREEKWLNKISQENK